MTQCGDIQEALLRGEAPSDAQARAHLEACPACAALVKGAGPLREALRTADPLGVDVEALFAGVKQKIDADNKDVRGYLRSRPTWLRVVIGFAAVLLVILPVLMVSRRPDFAEYPRGRMILTAVSMLVSLFVTLSIAMRPAYRPPIPRGAIGALAAVGLLLAFMTSATPLPGVENPAATLSELLPSAMPCFYFGLLFGAPVYVLMRALDHQVTRLAALLAASSAGLTANLALHLHCPSSHPGHMLLGHFSVAVAFLVVVAAVTVMFDRLRSKSANAR